MAPARASNVLPCRSHKIHICKSMLAKIKTREDDLMKKNIFRLTAILILLALFLSGCQTAEESASPQPTEILPTNTSVPPSATTAPTDTPQSTSPAVPTDTPTSAPPTSTAQPERLVKSIEELIGVWKGYWSDKKMILMEFKANKQYTQSLTNGDFAGSEWYDFKDGMFTWGKMIKPMNAATVCIDNPEANYEVYITFRGDQPEKLRFVLVGEDQCYDRQEFLDGKTL